MALRRDQFRRDRRAEPQLCRAQPRQPRLDRAMPASVSQPRAAALQGIDKMRANLALGLAQGIFLPHPRPDRAWLAELGTTIEEADPALAANAMSASAMWAANAATVSPAPDTADGKCHLTVANLRTMPHRSHEWPATLAQLRLAFAERRPSRSTARSRRRSATKARPTTCGWRRRMASRASRCSSTACRAAPFPARQHVEASKAIARLHRLDPERTMFAEQSEEAIAAGAFHNDVVAVANERVLFAHEKAFADKRRADRRLRAAGAGLRICRGAGRRGAAGRCDPLLSVQRPAGDPAGRRDDADRADRAPRDAVGLALDRAAPRRQRRRSAGSRSSTSASRWPMAAARPACGCASSPIRRRSIRASWSTRPSSTGSPRSSRGTGRSRSTTTSCSSRR